METKVFAMRSNLLQDKVHHLQNLEHHSSNNRKLTSYHLKFLQNPVQDLPAKSDLVIMLMMKMIIWKMN